MAMIKLAVLGTTLVGTIGVAQADPLTVGGKLAQLGALGILGTCLVAVTIALIKKDARANKLSDAQADAAKEMTAALQASTDASNLQTGLMIEVKHALQENVTAVRALTKATEWCEDVQRRRGQ